MKYDLRYVAVEYKHGWSVWIQRDSQKFMIGSAIETEAEVDELARGVILTDKERYVPKETMKELEAKVKELEKYKLRYENMVMAMDRLGYN